MKAFFIALAVFISSHAMAQTDSLPAAVYSINKSTPKKMGVVEKRQILSGKTLDLKKFEVYTLTLPAGKKYNPPAGDSQFEQLIVVKSGTVKLNLKDSSKTVGPGSLALVLAGDKITFENTSSEPTSWFVLNFLSKNENIQRGHDAGPSFIKDWNSLKVSKSPKGETRMVYDRPTTMFERFDVHATVLNNGFNSHEPHIHRAEELILMLNGNSQFQVAQDKVHADTGDAVFMASKVLHASQNVGGTAPCGYYAIQWHNLKTD
ncbi:MAG: cupin protein [Mucilaginibacter sp.]|nr:cupin protein [Mucilaginibacter sp.]